MTTPTQRPNEPRRAGVYVHVPWCRRRCPYCDFYFEVGAPSSRFVAAVHAELLARSAELPPAPAESLYFGGGTPSLLGVEPIGELIAIVRERPGLVEGAEITVEANPEDIDPALIEGLARAGVTRLSLGVQSFDRDVLRSLGRAHDGRQAAEAVRLARAAELHAVVDLIAGVPGESDQRLRKDLQLAAELDATGVSAYLLTVEPGTPLADRIQLGRAAPVDDDKQADAYLALQEALVGLGYEQVEVSSFARRGCAPVHNALYWSGGEWLGLGPSAASLRIDEDGRRVHTANPRDVTGFLVSPADAKREVETLTTTASLREAVAFGVRDMRWGVDLDELAQLHQTPLPDALVEVVEKHQRDGLLCEPSGRRGRVCLSTRGAAFADAVARDVVTC